MPDMVISVFKLENERGLLVPPVKISYLEKDTNIQWKINCGGTRAYFIRFGDGLINDLKDQSADSHFMVNRVTTTLFLSGCGLFRGISMGRCFLDQIPPQGLNVTTHLDLWKQTKSGPKEKEKVDDFLNWYGFIVQNTLFRRAAEDAVSALLNPVEVDFFIYRGMEWLLQAANIGWEELASDIGVSLNKIKKFKRIVNYELGQRHGIKSGHKRRAIAKDFGSLVADFIYGLSKVRKRVDKKYKVISSKKAARIVFEAMPLEPYP